MSTLLVLDTETTGLVPTKHTIWEIAWRIYHVADREPLQKKRGRMDQIGVGRIYQAMLTPDELTRADEVAKEVGRFDARYSKTAAEFPSNILWMLDNDIKGALAQTGEKAIHLVGAVPSFDHAMICSNWLGWPDFGEGLWHYHLIDVEALMAGALNEDPPWNSHKLSELLGVPHDKSKHHTAMGDVEWAADCYAAVMGYEIVGRDW